MCVYVCEQIAKYYLHPVATIASWFQKPNIMLLSLKRVVCWHIKIESVNTPRKTADSNTLHKHEVIFVNDSESKSSITRGSFTTDRRNDTFSKLLKGRHNDYHELNWT